MARPIRPRRVNHPRTTIGGATGSSRRFSLPIPASRHVATALLSVGIIALLFPSAAAHSKQDTKIRGSVVIDFNDQTRPNPLQEVTFTIPDQGRLAGIRVPTFVHGMPFRGQRFTVDFRNCLRAEITNGGQAVFHAVGPRHQDSERKGTTVRGTVTQLASMCLFDGNALVMPFDPFQGNPWISWIGQWAVWQAQLLNDDPDRNGLTNMDELREWFDLPPMDGGHSVGLKRVESHRDTGLDCPEGSRQVQCNRGGSATKVFSAEVRIKFQRSED